MAIIWQKSIKNKHYEVRRAGNSLRLYTNGVFHSQYNSREGLTGDLWELMCFPYLIASGYAIVSNVLVLGVGGGAVLKNLLDFNPLLKISGVDIDRQHLRIAKQSFGVGGKTQLFCDDAIHWVENYSGPRFDLIIDDLFGEVWSETIGAYEPRRAVAVRNNWQKSLLNILNIEGQLVFNMESKAQAQKLKKEDALRARFKQQVNFISPKYENCITAFYPFEQKSSEIRQVLTGHARVGRLLRRQPDAFQLFCGKFPTRRIDK